MHKQCQAIHDIVMCTENKSLPACNLLQYLTMPYISIWQCQTIHVYAYDISNVIHSLQIYTKHVTFTMSNRTCDMSNDKPYMWHEQCQTVHVTWAMSNRTSDLHNVKPYVCHEQCQTVHVTWAMSNRTFDLHNVKSYMWSSQCQTMRHKQCKLNIIAHINTHHTVHCGVHIKPQHHCAYITRCTFYDIIVWHSHRCKLLDNVILSGLYPYMYIQCMYYSS